MPGAPNRPPEGAPAPPPPTPAAPENRVLRRLAPARIVLSLDIWRGALSPDLLGPFTKAEAAFAAQDWREAESQLDMLSVRLHEPRWPTIPPPFQLLRVEIPRPQPPHWDPEHALAPAERDGRRARRAAEVQLELARASVAFAEKRGVDVADLSPPLARASDALGTEGVPPGFYAELDPLWKALRERLPAPRPATVKPVTPVASDPSAEESP